MDVEPRAAAIAQVRDELTADECLDLVRELDTLEQSYEPLDAVLERTFYFSIHGADWKMRFWWAARDIGGY